MHACAVVVMVVVVVVVVVVAVGFLAFVVYYLPIHSFGCSACVRSFIVMNRIMSFVRSSFIAFSAVAAAVAAPTAQVVMVAALIAVASGWGCR
jgi:hypothetical protein